MTAPFPHTAILASAGSGKTFALTSRYLALVAAGAAPGSILATSFTRVAAGEIRDRILARLAEAADDERARSDLAAHIGRPGIDRAGVLGLLRLLSRDMHRLQLRTLDSFFASVLRSFGLELGLAPDARIADEDHDRLLRREALRHLLDEPPGNMISLLTRLAQGAPERSVMRLLEEQIADLHSLDLDAGQSAWECVHPRPTLTADQLDGAARRLAAMPTVHAAKLAEDCARLSSDGVDAFLSKGLAKAILEGRPRFGTKAIEPEIAAAYEPIIDHARGVEGGKLRAQSQATHELLRSYDEAYRRLKQERRLLTFDDLPASVQRAAPRGRLDEVLFRIDAAVRHRLYDEFQDTRVQQWRAIAPLVEEIVSHAEGRSYFCVGDVKQSIYGWRDACPEILEGIASLLRPHAAGPITTATLAVSRRSAQPVIDCVNEVFERIDGNPALADDSAAAKHFAESFERHETAVKDTPGYVELRTAPAPPDGHTPEDARLAAGAGLAARLHRQGPGWTIGVLVATNDAVAQVLRELGPGGQDVPASGRGGGSLTDTPAVGAILDALRLADHPDDTTSAFNVARGPLGEVLGLTDEGQIDRRHQVARGLRRRLVGEGYAAVLAEWVGELAPSCDERTYRRLHELVNLAGEHERRATLRADDFVRMVELRAVPMSQPAPIEVMTIHQSKGLEFDLVVLPDLESELAGRRPPPVAFRRDGPAGPITEICPWVSGTVRDLLPELEDLFAHARARMVRESLCELYVAMTRARQGLFMIVDQVKKDPYKRVSGVVVGALASTPCAPDTIVYTHGDDAWLAAGPPATQVAEATAAPRIVLPEQTRARRAGAAAAAASAAALGGRRLAVELDLPDSAARDRGTALHGLFEQVEWIEEFQADRAALERIAAAAAPRRGAAWASRMIDEFLRSLETPGLREALSRRGRCAAGLDLERERPYARLLPDGGLDTGKIDRLEIERAAGGRATGAVVIDFKSHSIEPGGDGAAAAAASHRAQLEAYRSAAAAMLGLDETSVRMIVLFVGSGQAVELEGAAVTGPRAS